MDKRFERCHSSKEFLVKPIHSPLIKNCKNAKKNDLQVVE